MKPFLHALALLLTLGRPARDPIVLMYHSVSTDGWKLSVPPRAFEAHMSFLRSARTPVSLSDVLSHIEGGKRLPPGAVAVTFDDGYRDFLTAALPILNRHGIPATLFVPSDLSVDTSGRGMPRLSEKELSIVAEESLVSIGAHGIAHRKLTELPTPDARKEIVGGRDALRALLPQQAVDLFAYPFGARTPAVEALVEEAGFRGAVTITEGTAAPGTPRHLVPRVQIDRTMPFLSFVARTASALLLFRAVVTRVRSRQV